MQIKTIQWLVGLFPSAIRGTIAILLIVVFSLGTTVLFLYRENDRMQMRLDNCQQSRYEERDRLKDSLARQRQRENEQLAEQNTQLKKELEQIKQLKRMLYEQEFSKSN